MGGKPVDLVSASLVSFSVALPSVALSEKFDDKKNKIIKLFSLFSFSSPTHLIVNFLFSF